MSQTEERERAAPESLYADHLREIAARWTAALDACDTDAVLVTAGSQVPYFMDDQPPPFRVNPHFAQWFPHNDSSGSALTFTRGGRVTLHFCQPDDYWHAPPALPSWAESLDVQLHGNPDRVIAAALRSLQGQGPVALIGEHADANVAPEHHNPGPLVAQLDYQRATKTPFEVACMREATRAGVAGHVAARDAFQGGASEFELLTAFLTGSAQVATETPYQSIVALNEHSAVLHYQRYDRDPPAELRSFLIDAGARFRCYASDITRSYAARDDTEFAALIERLDREQQALCASLTPGVSYVAFHEDMHQRTANVLADHGLVRCSAEAAFARGLTRTFLPHGLGHLLGLQTHDVGGQQAAPNGGEQPPPEQYPALRLTREVELAQAFTVEPGIYFIPMLLDALRASPEGADVDWARVDALAPFGGIRIEDNVVVGEGEITNLTRDAFASVEAVDA